jgi:hypothetical protein
VIRSDLGENLLPRGRILEPSSELASFRLDLALDLARVDIYVAASPNDTRLASLIVDRPAGLA